MKRRRLAFLAALVVLAGAVAYLAWPAGAAHLYDANLVRLAESERQGYCAGETFWRTQGAGDATLAAECRARSQRPDGRDLQRVQPAFCAAIVDAGWEGAQDDCMAVLGSERYWPTYDGSISGEWNRARKYPAPAIVTSVQAPEDTSRTGGRSGERRPEDGDPRGPR